MKKSVENSRVVVKDETWNKRYKIGPYEDVYESKFAAGEAGIFV